MGGRSLWCAADPDPLLTPSDSNSPPPISLPLAPLHAVSDVQFVGGGAGDSAACDPDSLLLLTAGNDGAVCLWDLCWAAGTGRGSGGGGSLLPRCLARATDLHSDGIFSLHEYGGRVLTASKDCTVAISSLGGTASLAAVQQYDELHTGVVKCARWRDADTFASCGNDRLCVVDARQPPSAGAWFAFQPAWGCAVCERNKAPGSRLGRRASCQGAY